MTTVNPGENFNACARVIEEINNISGKSKVGFRVTQSGKVAAFGRFNLVEKYLMPKSLERANEFIKSVMRTASQDEGKINARSCINNGQLKELISRYHTHTHTHTHTYTYIMAESKSSSFDRQKVKGEVIESIRRGYFGGDGSDCDPGKLFKLAKKHIPRGSLGNNNGGFSNILREQETAVLRSVPPENMSEAIAAGLGYVKKASTSANFVTLGNEKIVASEGPTSLGRALRAYFERVDASGAKVVLSISSKPDVLKKQMDIWTTSTDIERCDDSVTERMFGKQNYDKLNKLGCEVELYVRKDESNNPKNYILRVVDWVDMKAYPIEGMEAISDVLKEIQQHQDVKSIPGDDNAPLFINCTAGVGRTGTMAMVMAIRSLSAEQKTHMSLIELLYDLRVQSSPDSVQTVVQLTTLVRAAEKYKLPLFPRVDEQLPGIFSSSPGVSANPFSAAGIAGSQGSLLEAQDVRQSPPDPIYENLRIELELISGKEAVDDSKIQIWPSTTQPGTYGFHIPGDSSYRMTFDQLAVYAKTHGFSIPDPVLQRAFPAPAVGVTELPPEPEVLSLGSSTRPAFFGKPTNMIKKSDSDSVMSELDRILAGRRNRSDG